MTRHLAAFYQSAAITTLVAINAVPDTQIFTSGTTQRVPPDLPFIASCMASYAGSTITQAQVETPSLRALANYDISALNPPAVTSANNNLDDRYDNPLALAGNETLTLSIAGTNAGAAAAYGIVEYCDGPVKPATGNFFTVQATGAATLSAGKFVNTAVTFDTVLPAGTYNVVGFRAIGANLVAARIAFVGGVYRPGVLGYPSLGSEDNPRYRAGMSGVYGSFDINQPPTVDCLGITDTAQTFLFDLVKTK